MKVGYIFVHVVVQFINNESCVKFGIKIQCLDAASDGLSGLAGIVVQKFRQKLSRIS